MLHVACPNCGVLNAVPNTAPAFVCYQCKITVQQRPKTFFEKVASFPQDIAQGPQWSQQQIQEQQRIAKEKCIKPVQPHQTNKSYMKNLDNIPQHEQQSTLTEGPAPWPQSLFGPQQHPVLVQPQLQVTVIHHHQQPAVAPHMPTAPPNMPLQELQHQTVAPHQPREDNGIAFCKQQTRREEPSAACKNVSYPDLAPPSTGHDKVAHSDEKI